MSGLAKSDLVGGGQESKSANYRMVITVGQSSPNQGTSTSPSYKMRGGLVGISN